MKQEKVEILPFRNSEKFLILVSTRHNSKLLVRWRNMNLGGSNEGRLQGAEVRILKSMVRCTQYGRRSNDKIQQELCLRSENESILHFMRLKGIVTTTTK